jgi:uncharacterized membrane protein HdeD (DUF308 family)
MRTGQLPISASDKFYYRWVLFKREREKRTMPSIEDFVQDLYTDKQEVSVPKDKVTELSPGWYTSKLNLPHKGSKGSWRNGRLHAHDMGDHYSVHLDRRDPKEHSIGHLVEDAPLMLFLWTGFRDATAGIQKEYGNQVASKKGWRSQVVIGLALLIVGLVIATDTTFALHLVLWATIMAFTVFGVIFIGKGISYHSGRRVWVNILLGVGAIVMAIVIYYYPTAAFKWLLLLLALWTLASGIFLIFGRGDKLLFDSGSIVPVIMGVISLGLALVLIIDPRAGIDLVIIIAGALVAFIGLMQLVSGLIIWKARRKSSKTTIG